MRNCAKRYTPCALLLIVLAACGERKVETIATVGKAAVEQRTTTSRGVPSGAGDAEPAKSLPIADVSNALKTMAIFVRAGKQSTVTLTCNESSSGRCFYRVFTVEKTDSSSAGIKQEYVRQAASDYFVGVGQTQKVTGNFVAASYCQSATEPPIAGCRENKVPGGEAQ
jgi:hypothetical protein